MKNNEKQNYVLTEAQMYYYQNTDVGKGTGVIVDIDLYDYELSEEDREYLQNLDCNVDIGKAIIADLEFQEEVSIISDEAIEYINKRSKKHKISNKYKNTKLF